MQKEDIMNDLNLHTSPHQRENIAIKWYYRLATFYFALDTLCAVAEKGLTSKEREWGLEYDCLYFGVGDTIMSATDFLPVIFLPKIEWYEFLVDSVNFTYSFVG